jgi:hypothetical protein
VEDRGAIIARTVFTCAAQLRIHNSHVSIHLSARTGAEGPTEGAGDFVCIPDRHILSSGWSPSSHLQARCHQIPKRAVEPKYQSGELLFRKFGCPAAHILTSSALEVSQRSSALTPKAFIFVGGDGKEPRDRQERMEATHPYRRRRVSK